MPELSQNVPVHLRGDISIRHGQASETGPKDRNEDCLGLRHPKDARLATKGIAAVIADGVSAAHAAKEASEAAVLGFLNDYYETPEPWEVKTAGQRVLGALNRWLFSQGLAHASAEKGCLCTFTALILKSHTGHFFHLGDSRLYRLRKGQLEQLTRDHATANGTGGFHLTRALGLDENPQIDYRSFSLEEGDRFLLSTDGIHEELAPGEIRELLDKNADPQAACEALVAAAQDSPDNRSCLVVAIDQLPDRDKDEVFRRLSQLPFPPDLEPGEELDGYRVQRLLVASKNTQLYLVKEIASGRELVMKTPSITFRDDPSYLERFALEEWIGLRTRHENLVRVIPPSQVRTRCYYLLEHLPGMTLTRWIEANPKAQLADIVPIVSQLISGTRALHRRDTLHQDLKPDNVIVLPGPVVKIIDYGSCRIAGISEIASPFERHSALGTVDFSAPEYRYGARPGTRSDLFSIAAITYFLVTRGQHPFGKNWENAQALRDFIKLPYQSATRHNPMVPLWFDAALRKALSPTAEARQESMSEFLANLRQPDYTLLAREDLPFIERNPLLFWKLTSALLAGALLLALLH
ncbi:bifunctional protein-serine/threonine kinase/phosphatase [Roseibacillus ishigakijimensis]|uniref:Bifunctional protein-serine/threonine kinase/phosphatase n=1 Tax=Roseibacillus ishigakijimensis TaxID=454146 RepID=A0A934RKE2_9BACT|nr:bifunctional protein-serine/threonine kinase/phosphatase [Roseibacillus ishigakijimensis]MBK1833332.1 bifunctional protein-serine/threonine kinase/phosphatase [Roseibacillus ishigakijimensis]